VRQPRPLPRSLVPLPGESLPGFLLRLSCRLNQPPARIAELTGLAPAGRIGASLPVTLLAGIPEPAIGTFAFMTRLGAGEIARLGMSAWQERYPPLVAGQGDGASSRGRVNGHLILAPATRYCPDCLAGDGSAIQQSFGGPWLRAWHLPVVFACPVHQRLLGHLCPECGQLVRGRRPGAHFSLLPATRVAGLHPAQCRTELVPGRGRHILPDCCGARLDQPEGRRPASPELITVQDKILDLLRPGGSGRTLSAGQPTSPPGYFADLQAVGLLACSTWPEARHLSPSEETASAIDEHVASLRRQAAERQQASPEPAARVMFGSLPADAAASAGLACIADRILTGTTGEVREKLRQLLPGGTAKTGRKAWANRITRSSPACSDGLQEASGPLLRGFSKADGHPRGRRNAVLRPERWGPENIPAFLEQAWFEDHLACLDCGSTVKAARRIAAATLVQWTAGGSIGNAARYLGFNPGGGQYAPTNDLARWLAALEPDQFTQALREITLRLDQASGLVNYQRRRQMLQDWALTGSEWNDIISRLPPVPGPNQPILDDRKRQEASAFVWARVTQGEPRFAPRPIEASQPDPVRRVWTNRRANTWHRLDCPGRIVHYTELRSLLIEHADQLARDIDDSTEATDKALAVGLAGTAVTARLPT
jgi:hypothetical protein